MTFDLSTHRHEFWNGVVVSYSHHILFDDWALVQIGRHVVGSGTDELYPALMGLCVGPSALEGRQERVVNIDNVSGEFLTHLRRKNLHVARENNHVDVAILDNLQKLELRVSLRLCRNGNMNEVGLVEVNDGLERLMIANHSDDLDRQPALALLGENVSEAMGFLRDHDERAHGTI